MRDRAAFAVWSLLQRFVLKPSDLWRRLLLRRLPVYRCDRPDCSVMQLREARPSTIAISV